MRDNCSLRVSVVNVRPDFFLSKTFKLLFYFFKKGGKSAWASDHLVYKKLS